MNLFKKQDGGLMDRLLKETLLARTEIRRGRFQRSMALITGASAIASGWEAYAQHQRGAFSDWLMWTPVYLTPPTAAVCGAALFSEDAARKVLPVLSIVSFADGVVGFIYHIRGIQRLPGGFSLGRYNIVMGPPIFAPLLTCTTGIAGFLTAFLRREALDLSSPSSLKQIATSIQAALPVGPDVSPVESWRSRIAHGEFQQGMALTAASFALLSGGEAYFEHLRGSFESWLMWTPVALTPPMIAAASGAMGSERIARDILPIISAANFIDGLVGFGLHLRGIKRMPGGFSNFHFNFTMGPPLFAPLLFTSVGLLGMIASLLRRKGE